MLSVKVGLRRGTGFMLLKLVVGPSPALLWMSLSRLLVAFFTLNSPKDGLAGNSFTPAWRE